MKANFFKRASINVGGWSLPPLVFCTLLLVPEEVVNLLIVEDTTTVEDERKLGLFT